MQTDGQLVRGYMWVHGLNISGFDPPLEAKNDIFFSSIFRRGDRTEKKWPLRGWEVENCTDDGKLRAQLSGTWLLVLN